MLKMKYIKTTDSIVIERKILIDILQDALGMACEFGKEWGAHFTEDEYCKMIDELEHYGIDFISYLKNLNIK